MVSPSGSRSINKYGVPPAMGPEPKIRTPLRHATVVTDPAMSDKSKIPSWVKCKLRQLAQHAMEQGKPSKRSAPLAVARGV